MPTLRPGRCHAGCTVTSTCGSLPGATGVHLPLATPKARLERGRHARNRSRSGAPRDLASFGQSSEANSSRCDDYERADEASRILGDKIDNISADLATSPRRVSEQDDTKARLCACENQLPEVLVFGQQEASMDHREVNDFGVGCLCVRLSHCHDIVFGLPESPDHRIVAALVGQEAHCYREC